MTDSTPTLDGHALRRLGRDVPDRFEVHAAVDGTRVHFSCQRRMRLLPGRRLVTTSVMHGRSVLLKIFYGPDAQAGAQREIDGASLLEAARVRAPERIAAGAIDGGKVVVFELIEAAGPLTASALPRATTVLAQLHAVALLHDDLKADNFLETRDGTALYCVDASAIRARGSPPSTRVRLDQLACLAAQFGLTGRNHLASMWAAYEAASPGALRGRAEDDLGAAFKVALAARVAEHVDKCLRDCTEFRVDRTWRRVVACRRDEWDALGALLDDPDAALGDGTPLKQGNSATVTRVRTAGGDVVVKRYNVGSLARRIRSLMRQCRALRAWRNGNRLRMLGIRTPEPLAVVVERVGPLRRHAWLVTAVADGERLDRANPLDHLDDIVQMFRQLAQAGLVHGDTKASNFVLCDDGLTLLDLDSMKSPRVEAARCRGRVRDVERFLANWPGQSRLRDAFTRAELL